MKADPLRVIEAAYADAPSDRAWLAHITEAVLPLLDDGLGLFTSLITTKPGKRPSLDAVVSGGGLEDAEPRQRTILSEMPAPVLAEAFGKNRISTLTEFFGKPIGGDVSPLSEQLTPYGARDSMGLVTINPSGSSCVISVPLRSPRILRPAFRDRWSRLMAHIGAGLRLRRAPDEDDEDAILDPTGAMQHAKPIAKSREARAALRCAARAIERARAKRRIAADDAVAAWRALAEGRWSLVDRFESDGRHFLIARKNPPRAGTPNLTEREACVVALAALGRTNKDIAYELGLSVGTIGTVLSRAARKLGVRTRAQLIAEWNARHSRTSRS